MVCGTCSSTDSPASLSPSTGGMVRHTRSRSHVPDSPASVPPSAGGTVRRSSSRSYVPDSPAPLPPPTSGMTHHTRSRSYVPDSPTLAASVAMPHHSNMQSRDRSTGQFVAADGASNVSTRRRTRTPSRRRIQAEEVPHHRVHDISPVQQAEEEQAAPHHRYKVLTRDQCPDHSHVIVISDKFSLHCTFSDDSAEETGELPKVLNEDSDEIRKKAERLCVLLKRKCFHYFPNY